MAAKEISVKKYVVRLSGEERERLETLIRKGKSPARRVLKARILLKVKWLRRLEVSDKPYYTREETSKYTDLITTTGKSRIFTFTMEAKSVITFPSGEMKLPGAGFYEITGLAWSGRGKIARVEISADGGKNWSLTALQEPVLPICQTRFRFPWLWDGTPSVIQSRATDETGYSQPTHKQLVVSAVHSNLARCFIT
jgi:sulfane dehydrogenase subunit SoxC